MGILLEARVSYMRSFEILHISFQAACSCEQPQKPLIFVIISCLVSDFNSILTQKVSFKVKIDIFILLCLSTCQCKHYIDVQKVVKYKKKSLKTRILKENFSLLPGPLKRPISNRNRNLTDSMDLLSLYALAPSTTPIVAMGCRQCLPFSIYLKLKAKHC